MLFDSLGISLVPSYEIKYPNIKYIAIADAHFDRKIFLIWKKGSISLTMKKQLDS